MTSERVAVRTASSKPSAGPAVAFVEPPRRHNRRQAQRVADATRDLVQQLMFDFKVRMLDDYQLKLMFRRSARVWKTPEGTWVVRVLAYDKLCRRTTNFVGPYATRELARVTQRCIKQLLNIMPPDVR